ncbi:MAG TPA: ABC transporter permease [Caulobacteraceae bacterium]|jgi:ABC-2 type transport system permease protein
MRDTAEIALPPQPRAYSGVNWVGLRALYLREVRRFWKVGLQTLAAPIVTALLYMMVFVVAVGGRRHAVEGVPFGAFIAPGLIMMQILNNAFSNSSSSLLQAKMNGLIGDFLTPPLSPGELTAGFALGAVTRGLLVGAVAAAAIFPFAHYGFAQPWAILYFGFGASLIMGLLGAMAAIWSEKFDHIAAVTNFIVMPMTFLSGTFYLVSDLPAPFNTISQFNPFFYLIAGFRYGFTGHMDGNLGIGVGLTAALCLALWAGCWRMFATGYKLKT